MKDLGISIPYRVGIEKRPAFATHEIHSINNGIEFFDRALPIL